MARNNEKKEKIYRNPTKTLFGKILIWTLAILMGCSGLISVIYLIIQASK